MTSSSTVTLWVLMGISIGLGIFGGGLLISSLFILLRGGNPQKVVVEQNRSAKCTPIAELQPGMDSVTLRGTISEVVEPVNPDSPIPQAMLRLRVEALEENPANGEMEWKSRTDRMKVSPFQLKDSSGSVWVDARQMEKYRLMDDSFIPSKAQINEMMNLLDISSEVTEGWRVRYQMWELQENQVVTVIGSVLQAEGQTYIGKLQDQPMIITPLEPKGMKVKVEKIVRTPLNWSLIGGLGLLGIVLLCLAWVSLFGLIYRWYLNP